MSRDDFYDSFFGRAYSAYIERPHRSRPRCLLAMELGGFEPPTSWVRSKSDVECSGAEKQSISRSFCNLWILQTFSR